MLDHWFESDVLKATLATDGVIGAMISPHDTGSGLVSTPFLKFIWRVLVASCEIK